jgi:predicted PurR-regulated permease PerM
MNTTVLFIALVLLIVVGFTVLTAGLVTINNKIDEVQDTINILYETYRNLISTEEDANKTMLDLCNHVKEVIKDNADLIQAIHNLTKPKP